MTTDTPTSKLPTLAAAGIGVIVLCVLCSYQVRVSQLAILTTLGKPTVVDKPGLHLRFPWPIQKITRFDGRNQLLNGIPRETTTRDNINLIVELFSVWTISDPLLFFNSVGNSLDAEANINSLIISEQETVFRNHDVKEIISVNADENNLSILEKELLSGVQEQASRLYGVSIEFIGIAQLSLHEANTASIFNRMKQEQAKIAAKISSEGEKNAKIIRDNANSKKAQIVARAEADAKRIKGEALITAAEQYEKFNQDLDFAIFLRKLDALEETMKTKTTIILDPETPPYDLLKYGGK